MVGWISGLIQTSRLTSVGWHQKWPLPTKNLSKGCSAWFQRWHLITSPSRLMANASSLLKFQLRICRQMTRTLLKLRRLQACRWVQARVINQTCHLIWHQPLGHLLKHNQRRPLNRSNQRIQRHHPCQLRRKHQVTLQHHNPVNNN